LFFDDLRVVIPEDFGESVLGGPAEF